MKIKVTGNQQLKGTIDIKGAKNSALPIICASLLTKDIVRINNVPNITDVFDLLEIIKDYNVTFEFENNTLLIDSRNIRYHELNHDLVGKIRGSYYLMSTALVLFNKINIPKIGGCKIGERPINYHLYAFKKMGFIQNDDIIICKKTKCNIIFFKRKSVGATINSLIASMKVKRLIILNPSLEPEVLDLISFLQKLGRKIKIYKNFIISTSFKEIIHDNIIHTLIPDRIEAFTYMTIGALLGDITVKKINLDHLKEPIKVLKKIGANLIINEDDVRVIHNEIKGIKIKCYEYPRFPTDAQPILCALLSYAKTRSIVYDNIFTHRFKHAYELNKINGNNNIFSNHIIIYPSKLKGGNLVAYDLRCAASLLVASLKIDGITVINNIELINRGYDNIIYNLIKLGAIIE